MNTWLEKLHHHVEYVDAEIFTAQDDLLIDKNDVLKRAMDVRGSKLAAI